MSGPPAGGPGGFDGDGGFGGSDNPADPWRASLSPVARPDLYPAQPGAGPPSGSGTGRETRGGRRIAWWVAVGLSALVVVAGGTTAVVSYLRIDSPATVVRSYFAALRAGDAPLALRYGRAPSGDTRFLTSAVLKLQQRAAEVSVPNVLSTERTGSRATVTASYSVGGGAPLSQPVSLRLVARHWLLETTALAVRVDPGSARNRATLAGSALPGGSFALFPGGLPITYDTDNLRLGADSDHVTFRSSGVLRVDTELTDSAGDIALDSVKKAMAACLKAADAAAPTCPLTPASARTVPNSLRGQLKSFAPTSAPALLSSDPDGLVEVAGTFSVDGTWTTLDFNNQPQTQNGTATVPATVRLYITKPADVAWVTS